VANQELWLNAATQHFKSVQPHDTSLGKHQHLKFGFY
jgi:hypothetical protein